MARKSGGMMGKLMLLGIGAAIGAAMTQKKADSNGTEQTGNMKENMKKGLDRFNEQSGGMVDKVKPGVSKAVEAVKGAIDSQQKMMDKEKDMLDKGNQTLQDEVGESSGQDSSSQGSSEQDSSSEDSSNTSIPSGGVYGGSTAYTEALKKDLNEDDSKKGSTFDK